LFPDSIVAAGFVAAGFVAGAGGGSATSRMKLGNLWPESRSSRALLC